MAQWIEKIAAFIAANFRAIMLIGVISELFIWGVSRLTVTIAMVMLFAAWVPSALGAFFGISRERTLSQNLKCIGATYFNGIVYGLSDYWLAWMSWLMIVFLMKFGLGYADMLVWMWAFDIAAATGYLLFDRYQPGKDITQAGSYRSAIDETLSKSKAAGILYILYVAGRAIAWDGPERIILVFKKEWNTPAKRLIPLLGMTLVQALIWTKIYSLGTDSVSEAIKIITGR